MKEIRLCDDALFDKTITNCLNNNVGIEIQQFHDLVIRNGESEVEYNNRINQEINKIKKELKQFSKGISLHGPFWEMNVGSKVPEIVSVAKKYYEQAYNIAKELGCSEIVFHNGYYPGTSYEPNWIERSINFWKDFLKDKGDIVICLENQFELNSSMLKEIIDGVNDDRLKICLDIGHVYANSNMTIEEWIETLGDRIVYYHLHNNHGKKDIKDHNNDEHLGLSEGTIDISKALECSQKYSPDAIWCLESKVDSHLNDLKLLESLGYK